MEFIVNTGEKELSVVSWLLRQKEIKNSKRNKIFYIIGLLFLAMGLYVYLVQGKDLMQTVILIIISCICITKSKKKISHDYDEIAYRKNKSIREQKVLYRFLDTHIESATVLSTNKCKWSKCKLWGVQNGCVYIMLKGGNVIIIDESKYEETQVSNLKVLLENKIEQRGNSYEI